MTTYREIRAKEICELICNDTAKCSKELCGFYKLGNLKISDLQISKEVELLNKIEIMMSDGKIREAYVFVRDQIKERE